MWYFRQVVAFLGLFLIFSVSGYGQCQVIDDSLNVTSAPIYYPCSYGIRDTVYTLKVIPAAAITGSWTINWGDGTANSTGTNRAAGDTIFHVYTPNSGGSIADTFIYTFSYGSCTITGTVVNSFPIIASIETPGLTSLTCAPGTLTFFNNSNRLAGFPVSPGTQFTFDWGDGSPLEIYGFTNAGDTVYHTYQRNTVTCETTVKLTAVNHCLAPNSTSESTIYPTYVFDLDEAQIDASATVLCYPDTIVTLRNGSYFNCIPLNSFPRKEYWNYGDYWGKNQDSTSGGWLNARAPTKTLAFPRYPGTYTINMLDSNRCGVDPASIVIQIVDPPQAAIAISDDTICAGQSVTLQNLSTGGANLFAWDFGEGAGFTTTGGGNQNHTYNTAGTYTIRFATGITGSNCGDTTSIELEVLPSPTAVIGLDNQVGCDSLNVMFSDSSTGGPISWSWDFDNGQTSTAQHPGLQFYGFPANFNVSLTVTNADGCDNTANEVINVFQTPVPLFSPDNVCANTISQFMDSSTHASGDPIIAWIWDFGDNTATSNLQNPTHTYANAGTYNLILNVSTANCSAQDTLQLTAEEIPTADFTMDTTFGCSPLAVNFTNASSVNAVKFYWEFPNMNTDTLEDPSYVFVNNYGVDSVFDVKLVASTLFGCTDTTIKTVEVYPNPVAAFSKTVQPINCSPAIVPFTNLSSNGAVSYLWDFGTKTTTVVHPTDTFENNNLFAEYSLVTLVAYSANGCRDTTRDSIYIAPKPTGIQPGIDTGCAPLSVTMPLVQNAVTYRWNFGLGQGLSTLQQPTHLYSTPGDYTVQLVLRSANNCVDTSYGLVRVHPNPTAFFTPSATGECSPANINFVAQSPGADFYKWDFGNNMTLDTTDSLAQSFYINNNDTTRIYDVKLIVENSVGCADSSTNSIAVFPVPTAAFSHDTAGCSPYTVPFTNNSSVAASGYGWDFGDGQTSPNENPTHLYLNNGTAPDTFIVSLKTASLQGCSDSVGSKLIVYPQPNASFAIFPPNNTLTYPDTVFTINNLDLNWRAKWDFGDSTTSMDSIPGSHGYTGWGVFTIKLVTYNEFCEDSTEEEVTILPPPPIANFGDSTAGCENLTVQFVNKSKYASSYKWEFIHTITTAKQSSSDKDPEIVFTDPGLYNVSLFVTGDGGNDQITKFGYIEVYEQPTAYFTFAPEEVYIPNEATVCFNNSRGEDLSYSWDFGDGSPKQSAEHPEHYYSIEGEYKITLEATNGFCTDTYVSETPVKAFPSGSIKTPNAFTPSLSGDPGVDGGYDFGGSAFPENNIIFYPKITGEIKDYEFMIFNKWGELLFRTTSKTTGWTGWYRHELCQQDVYVFKVKATMIDNSEQVIAGDLTLLR